jgi:hypothetical protein
MAIIKEATLIYRQKVVIQLCFRKVLSIYVLKYTTGCLRESKHGMILKVLIKK